MCMHGSKGAIQVSSKTFKFGQFPDEVDQKAYKTQSLYAEAKFQTHLQKSSIWKRSTKITSMIFWLN